MFDFLPSKSLTWLQETIPQPQLNAIREMLPPTQRKGEWAAFDEPFSVSFEKDAS
jgi:hypothetical protein